MPTRLLEREEELRLLAHVTAEAGDGRGSVVLVAGEAGIGKSSLLEAWLADVDRDVRILWAACDDLSTPRPLGPLRELLPLVPTLAGALEVHDTLGVASALLDELGHPLRSSVLVIEDVHWADDATLDVLRYVGRRIDDRRGVVALTYRDDELDPDHPLHAVLGALTRDRVFRLRPQPLSTQAIRRLGGPTNALDADHVARVTSGNPFFVTELLGAGTDDVPDTVAASVLGRLSQLPPDTREAVAVLACAPGGLEPDLVDHVVPNAARVLAPAEARGLFANDVPGRVRFRHELVRQSVVNATPPTQLARHHRSLLAALMARRPTDSARVLHHAAGADNAEVLAKLAPPAAQEAFRSGSHRQAAAYGDLALRHPDLVPIEERATLWEQHAWSLHYLHRSRDAADAAANALALRRETGEEAGVLRALTTRATMRFMAGDAAGGAEDFGEANTLVTDVQDPQVLAEFGVLRLTVQHLRGDHASVLADGPGVVESVTRAARPDLALLAHIYHAGSRVAVGDHSGIDELANALDVRTSASLMPGGAVRPVGASGVPPPGEAVARGHLRLAAYLVVARRWDDAQPRLEAAVDFFEDHGFQFHRHVTLARLARLHVERAAWSHARGLLGPLLEDAPEAGIAAIGAAHAAALLALRTNEPRAEELVRSAWQLGADSQTEDHLVDGALAMLEWAWLHDDRAAVDEVASLALAAGQGVRRAPVLWWLARNGRSVETDGNEGSSPEALSLAGDHEAAAKAWATLGMPYHQALELVDSGVSDLARRGLEILFEIDATGAVPAARRRLRDMGVRSIPNGPLARTRANPAGLTPRQVEVLTLVAADLTNAQIADQLVLSVRTVEHHVSAILQKLDVPDRETAAGVAADLGIGPTVPDDQPAPS